MEPIYECKFCNKSCKNPNSLRNHERLCKLNPNRDKSNLIDYNNQKEQTWNKGLTKYDNLSLLSMSIKLTKKRPDWQVEVDNDGKLYGRYLNKRNNAKKEGLVCDLTFQQYCSLVKEAGIKSSDLGFSIAAFDSLKPKIDKNFERFTILSGFGDS